MWEPLFTILLDLLLERLVVWRGTDPHKKYHKISKGILVGAYYNTIYNPLYFFLLWYIYKLDISQFVIIIVLDTIIFYLSKILTSQG